MSLRIEVCDLQTKNWSLFQRVLPGQAQMLIQILSDVERVYLAECDSSDQEAAIYVNTIPANDFRKKIVSEGVHDKEDYREVARIRRGEVYQMSLKLSDRHPVLVYKFKHD
jgi:hypothetical protein